MHTVRRGLYALLLGAALALAGDEAAGPTPYITAVRLEGMVDDGMTVLVTRALREVADSKAIVFIVDTPGGRVDSAIQIVDAIVDAPCKTIAFVDGMGAISAGALISYACDEIVMSPSTNMGAAQPVTIGSDGMEPLGEKETSFVRAKFAALAEMKGRNPDIAMAMVDKDIELRAYQNPDGTLDIRAVNRPAELTGEEAVKELIDDPGKVVKQVIETIIGEELPIPEPKESQNSEAAPVEQTAPDTQPTQPDDGIVIEPAGKLLTLTPQEAKKYGVIKYIAKDMDDLMWQLGYTNTAVVNVTPTWSEDLYKWLISPEITLVLLVLGIGGLYLEFKTPGFGMPGIVGICALAIYFGSRSVVGLADWLDIALVITGVILLLVEIFLIPGFGIVGALGIVFVLAGIVFSFTFTDFSLPQYSWEWDRLEDAGFALTMTMICMVVLVVATWKLLPRSPLYRRLVLADQQLPTDGYSVQTPDEAESTIGQVGVASSMLRPAGRGRFGDKTFQVVSLNEFIEEGTPIVIVQAEGNRYVVDRLKKPA
ncbi:MAG: ATP-dependent Clp protease proteolytic subunit [Candidatus Hydrogenedentes bacterium]|nr:ATP-dependent Clp protease proteolytic subunit [Candidatus Hydrogenedentota bacterium]